MNNRGSVGKDALTLTISKIITLLIALVTARLLSDFRTLEEYGTYSQLLLVINLATSIFMLGLPNSINYFLARAETVEERKHFLSVYYCLSTMLSAIMGIALAFLVPVITAYFNNPYINSFVYFLAIYPWSNVISSSIENILVVYQKTRFLMAYKLINSACLLGVVVFVQLSGMGFTQYMIVYLGASVAFAISVYVISGQMCGGLAVNFDKTLIVNIFKFSVPLGIASVVGTVNIEIDKLLIGRLMDTSQMAIYSNASKELPLTIVATSITAVLLPRMAILIKKNKNKDAIELWKVATELSMIIIAIIVAAIFVFGSDIITLLYTEKYLSGLPVFRVYTLVLLLRVTYFGIVLNATGQTKKVLFCSIASLALNVILNPLFYYLMGMIGPAIATFVAIFVIMILQLKMTSKIVDIKFSRIFPWKATGALILVNVIFAFIFAGTKYLIPLERYFTSLGESIMLGSIWVALYFVVLRKRIILTWNRLNNSEVNEK